MNKSRYPLFIVFVILVAITLFACESNEQTNEPIEKQKIEINNVKMNDEPLGSVEITGALYATPTGVFNPIFIQDAYEESILSFTHEQLVTQNESLEFIPQLAKKWEVNEDYTELTVYLEEGIKWHDGEKFTAHDVLFTYQVIADPDYIEAGGLRTAFVQPLLGYNEYVQGNVEEFTGIQVINDYTIKFVYKEPTVNPLFYISAPIIPEHIFKDIPVADIPNAPESTQPDKVIGTGPFIFTHLEEGDRYVLKRFDNYWQGQPFIDTVVWQVVAPPVLPGLMESGEIDFIADPIGIQPPEVNKFSNLTKITLIEQSDFNYQLLGYKHNHLTPDDIDAGIINPNNWVANDKLSTEIREAISYAIDRNKLIDEVYDGHGTVLHAPIPIQSWAYNEELSTNYNYNPEKAKSILDELGYIDTEDDDKFREDANGNEWVLNFNYPTGNEIREKTAEHIQVMLNEIGINVNMRKSDTFAQYIKDLSNNSNDWDLYLMEWDIPTIDPDPSYIWQTESPYNFSRWHSPESEELLNKALSTPDAFDEGYRQKVYKEWQQIFSTDLPALILFSPNTIWAYNERIQGVNPLPTTMFHDVHLWQVKD
ncbi:ABC transporter substrate-binding protein [Ornithinibacillus halotolerans]|uniref:ABC transporter substrate-binding protein n=1 Tax=Ornithinibacillus halotolerans TaxID=1274357 RepID=UPI00166C4891|nr:ABC transporter substrate-binding protein [Ornithinibacillus halotolerans]